MPLRTRTAYFFLAPFMSIFVVFWIWPIGYSAWLSLLNTQGAS
ncbi:hypothetical protein Q5Y75_17265 [Ruegeria sp. 2205SS24-7]|nr:hypothetical protein [Ruegeria sp. 2205SS24-7]MDP5218972.1 hypothetical protein [Ruegeria sp. 2205SS24-7]